MVWLVDDLAEAALGPWGLAVAAGASVLTVIRRRQHGVASTPPAGSWAADKLDGAAAVADDVKGRVQTALAEVGEYWRDLYAEAHSEWEQDRAGKGSARATTRATVAPRAIRVGQTRATSPGRVRGPNGRYVKTDA